MLRKSNVYFYLLTRTKNSTIYARISVCEDSVARSTSQKISKENWDQDTQRVRSTHPQSETINETLSVIENQVRQAENTLINKHDPVTLDGILNQLEEDDRAVSFFKLFHDHNKQMKELAEKGEIAEATYTKYCTMESHAKKFLQEVYGKEDIYLSELNLKFVEDLQHWFKVKQDLAHNTTLKYLKHIKKIVNIALRRGYILKDPFDGFNMTKKEKTPTHLTIQELKRIEAYDFSECGRLDQVRDCFVFGCYTGLAYSDMSKLNREEDFYKDPEGDLWLCQNRTKTDEPANVLILSKPRQIYEKYLHLESVLPVISNVKMNAYLKEIADVSFVSKRLTTHVARHTFATTITLGHGMPIESVQIMMGHRDRRSTEHYARVTNYKLTADMKKLKERFSEV